MNEQFRLFAAIRRESRAALSGRAIERKYRVSRRTVAKALASAWPEPRKKVPQPQRMTPPAEPLTIRNVTARQLAAGT